MTLEEEIRQTLGTNIKRFRVLNRLSQEELAERIAISANFLSNIEIGRKWISPLTLAKLSEALKIEAFELFKPKDAPDSDTLRYTDEIFQTITDSIETIRKMYRAQL
jgi:transcriptional regulator with XRE-family HTH domain